MADRYNERRPSDFTNYSWKEALNAELDPPKKYLPLYAFAWGWNASGRAGNATESKLISPSHVQRSIKSRYIASAAGKHHSLLVTDEGCDSYDVIVSD